MSSVVVSTSAALSRHFVFEDEAEPDASSFSGIGSSRAALDRTAGGGCSYIDTQPGTRRPRDAGATAGNGFGVAGVTAATRLEIRPAPEMVSSGIAELDAMTGGLPRGCVTEICGAASSGRTTLLLASLMAATRRGEFCAVVDASDALDTHSAAAAGVELGRLLWVRCGDCSSKSHPSQRHTPASLRASSATEKSSKNNLRNPDSSERRLEQVLRATDLLLESGGFGMIVLDLADLPPLVARRIPLTTWFRFRRAIEHTPTILLAVEQQAIAGSCSSLLLQLGSSGNSNVFPNKEHVSDETDASESFQPAHVRLLTGLNINAEVVRSRLERKPARSVAALASKTAWAG